MRRRTALPLGMLLVLTLTAGDCEDPEVVPVATSLERVSGDAQQAEVGAQLPAALVVQVLDQNGDPMSGITVDWSADAGTVTAGEVTDGDGQTSATWTLGTEVGAQAATATLEADTEVEFTATAVAGALETITLTPDSVGFDALGDTTAVAAAGTDAHGNAVGFTATWTLRDTTVAEVDANGNVASVGNGATWVVVASNGVSDSARVTVEQEAATVAVSPQADTVVVGGAVAFTAEAQDANGNTVSAAVFTWSTVDAGIATTDSSGLVTGVAEGTTSVIATHGSLADSAEITVDVSAGLDADLIGEWVETSLVYENQNNASQSVEVAEDGYLAILTLRADGTFRLQEETGFGSDIDVGTWSVSGDTIVVESVEDDTTYHFPYTKPSADEFTFTVLEDEGWDFDDDGVYEPTITTSMWSRRTDLPGLVGTWNSESFVVVNNDDSSQTADLSADISITITFQSDGSHTVTISDDSGTEVDVGWYVTAPGNLWVVESGDVTRLTLELSGDTASVSFQDTFDFDEDGFEEDATFTIGFVRGTTGSTGELDADLIGEWLGVSYVLENQNDTSQEIDVVAEEGWLMELSFNADGTWYYLETYSDGDVGWTDAGTWSTRNDSIVYYSNRAQDTLLIPYAKAGDLFSFETVGEEGWDFNGDGIDEPTNEFAVLAPRIDAQLVGTWEAESMVLVEEADTTQSVDAIAEGGSLTVTFYTDGTVFAEQVEPDLADEWDFDGETHTFSAGYAAAEPYLWFVDSGGTDQLFLSVDGDLAVVVSEYYLDGTQELVIETIVLTRQ